VKLKVPYKDLDHTLLMLKEQVKASIPFARSFLPPGKMTPEQIYRFLSRNCTYVNDPDGIELLQSMRTLFSDRNRHGIYGAGDCDCFTIAALASLYVKGYGNGLGIYLTGRSKNAPSHIYAAIYKVPFDLTNEKFNEERYYPYKQHIPVKL
jgi:hypothetical protein